MDQIHLVEGGAQQQQQTVGTVRPANDAKESKNDKDVSQQNNILKGPCSHQQQHKTIAETLAANTEETIDLMQTALVAREKELRRSEKAVARADAELREELVRAKKILPSKFLFNGTSQLFFRRWWGITLTLRLQAQCRAVTTIIRVYRGHQGRREAQRLRRELSAMQAQKRQLLAFRIKYRSSQAVKLQMAWRRYLRLRAIKYRQARQAAAILLQRAFRTRQWRGQSLVNALANARKLFAAVSVQKLYRGYRARRKLRESRQRQRQEERVQLALLRSMSKQARAVWMIERRGAGYLIAQRAVFPYAMRMRWHRLLGQLRRQRAAKCIAKAVCKWFGVEARREAARAVLIQKHLRRWVQQRKFLMAQARRKKIARRTRLAEKTRRMEQVQQHKSPLEAGNSPVRIISSSSAQPTRIKALLKPIQLKEGDSKATQKTDAKAAIAIQCCYRRYRMRKRPQRSSGAFEAFMAENWLDSDALNVFFCVSFSTGDGDAFRNVNVPHVESVAEAAGASARMQQWYRVHCLLPSRLRRVLQIVRRRDETLGFCDQSLRLCRQHKADELVAQSLSFSLEDALRPLLSETTRSPTRSKTSPTKQKAVASNSGKRHSNVVAFPVLQMMFLMASGWKMPFVWRELDGKTLFQTKLERTKAVKFFRSLTKQGNPVAHQIQQSPAVETGTSLSPTRRNKKPVTKGAKGVETFSSVDVDVAVARATGGAKGALDFASFVRVIGLLGEISLTQQSQSPYWGRFDVILLEMRRNLRKQELSRAAVVLQTQARELLARRELRRRMQETYEKFLDPTWGLPYWMNPRSAYSTWQKPRILGAEDVQCEPVPFPLLNQRRRHTLSSIKREHELERLLLCGLCKFQLASRRCLDCIPKLKIKSKPKLPPSVNQQKEIKTVESASNEDQEHLSSESLFCDVCFGFLHRRGGLQTHRTEPLLELCTSCIPDDQDDKHTASHQQPPAVFGVRGAVQWDCEACGDPPRRVCGRCALQSHPKESCGQLRPVPLQTLGRQQRTKRLREEQEARDRADLDKMRARALRARRERCAQRYRHSGALKPPFFEPDVSWLLDAKKPASSGCVVKRTLDQQRERCVRGDNWSNGERRVERDVPAEIQSEATDATWLAEVHPKQAITESVVPLVLTYDAPLPKQKRRKADEEEDVVEDIPVAMFLVEFSLDPRRTVWINHSLAERFWEWKRLKLLARSERVARRERAKDYEKQQKENEDKRKQEEELKRQEDAVNAANFREPTYSTYNMSGYSPAPTDYTYNDSNNPNGWDSYSAYDSATGYTESQPSVDPSVAWYANGGDPNYNSTEQWQQNYYSQVQEQVQALDNYPNGESSSPYDVNGSSYSIELSSAADGYNYPYTSKQTQPWPVRAVEHVKAAPDEESEGEDDEAEIERRLVAEAQAEAEDAKRESKGVYNREALLALVKDWDAKPLPWVETLDTCAVPLELESVHDDLKREVAFYNNTLAGVRLAKDRLKKDGVAYKRPDDYFAEMLKSDAHMAKVKDKLIYEQKKITAVEERKKSQAHRKVAKEVQAEKIKERNQQKKDTLEAVKQWKKRKGNDKRGGLKDDDDTELDSIVSGKRKHAGGGDRDGANKKPRVNKTRGG
ncbi:Eukaryotic rRNA processing [Phytophthora cactorum]|nr:Eukaryotic rRNA processing [Phytophthora cactorum]